MFSFETSLLIIIKSLTFHVYDLYFISGGDGGGVKGEHQRWHWCSSDLEISPAMCVPTKTGIFNQKWVLVIGLSHNTGFMVQNDKLLPLVFGCLPLTGQNLFFMCSQLLVNFCDYNLQSKQQKKLSLIANNTFQEWLAHSWKCMKLPHMSGFEAVILWSSADMRYAKEMLSLFPQPTLTGVGFAEL